MVGQEIGPQPRPPPPTIGLHPGDGLLDQSDALLRARAVSPPTPPLTGVHMNSASLFTRRAVDRPAVVSNTWDDHWVWWVGPCAGSLGATMVRQTPLSDSAPPSERAVNINSGRS